jgi:ABC-type amino acid transport system permease subunit
MDRWSSGVAVSHERVDTGAWLTGVVLIVSILLALLVGCRLVLLRCGRVALIASLVHAAGTNVALSRHVE